MHTSSKEGSIRKHVWYQRVLFWCMRSKWQTLSYKRWYPFLWLVTLLHCSTKGRMYLFLDKISKNNFFSFNWIHYMASQSFNFPLTKYQYDTNLIRQKKNPCLLQLLVHGKSCIVDENWNRQKLYCRGKIYIGKSCVVDETEICNNYIVDE